MDSFTEQIIKAKPTFKQRMMLVGAGFIIAVGAFILLFIDGSIGLSVMVLGIVVDVVAVNSQHYEYEYEITNGDCDVSRITNQTNRKMAYSFLQDDVKRILPVDSDKYRNEIQVGTSKPIIKDFTSRNVKQKSMWYAFFVTHNGEEHIVLLELHEKAYNQMKDRYKLKFEA
ncbi:MAG: DUF6106 family protein [Lachnospiraceae bacterium]|nr:DUF6106 family protein [Lachnospiraceae bacterium]